MNEVAKTEEKMLMKFWAGSLPLVLLDILEIINLANKNILRFFQYGRERSLHIALTGKGEAIAKGIIMRDYPEFFAGKNICFDCIGVLFVEDIVIIYSRCIEVENKLIEMVKKGDGYERR